MVRALKIEEKRDIEKVKRSVSSSPVPQEKKNIPYRQMQLTGNVDFLKRSFGVL